MRKLLNVLLLVVVAGALYQFTQGELYIPGDVSLQIRHTPESQVIATATSLSPAQLREKMRASYRLPPDRRLSGAVIWLARLAGVSAPDNTTYVDGGWQLNAAGLTVRFDDLPTYTQARQAIDAFAQAMSTKMAITKTQSDANESPLTGLEPRAMQRELKLLDVSWNRGEHNEIAIRRAAMASVRLFFVTRGDTEASDALATQAVALMSLATATGAQMPLEESMLAWKLGYTRYAISQAQALPEGHPWRLYLARKDDQLADAIKRDPEFAYLLVSRLAQRQKPDEWIEAVNRYGLKDGQMSIHMLATGIGLSNMGIQQRVALDIPVLTVLSMNGDVNDKSLTSDIAALRSNLVKPGKRGQLEQQQQKAVERVVDANQKDITGPFYTKTLFDSYNRDFIESGLYIYAKAELDRRSDLSSAKVYAFVLRVIDSEAGNNIALWLSHLTSSSEGHPDRAALLADVANSQLGIRLRRRSLDEWLRYSTIESAQNMMAVKKLYAGMDSRISDRYEMAQLARSQLYHLALTDRLYTSIAENEDNRTNDIESYLAYYNNDVEGLLAVAEDTSLSFEQRIAAVDYLEPLDLGDEYLMRIKQSCEALVNSQPTSWTVREKYINLLKKESNYQEIVRQATDFLAKAGKDADFFDESNAKIDMSNAYLALGDANKAWNVIEPEIRGQYGGTLRQAIDVKLAMGDFSSAERIAQFDYERYPDSLKNLLPLVVVEWRKSNYDKAASLLKQWNYPINMVDWRFMIGRSLAEQVKEHGIDTVKALVAFQHAGVSPFEINQMALALDEVDPHNAAEVHRQLRVSGLAQVAIDLDTYKLMSDAGQSQDAEQWLRQRMANIRQDAVAGIALERHVYDVPWQVADATHGPYIDGVWLYRATVYAIGKEHSAKNSALIDDYYAHAKGTFYDQLGAMVLGKIPEKEIADKPMSNRQISEASFYLGIRAVNEGHYREGGEWLRVSMETGEQRNGEYRWSLGYLMQWRNYGQNMKSIAANGKLF